MEYLYHYTSIETLALILENKTLCFNNLLYVEEEQYDDLSTAINVMLVDEKIKLQRICDEIFADG